MFSSAPDKASLTLGDFERMVRPILRRTCHFASGQLHMFDVVLTVCCVAGQMWEGGLFP